MSDTDHSTCPPGSHSRDTSGADEQRVAPDGFLACNDCQARLFYCQVDEWYAHLDPTAGCWLHPAWGVFGQAASPMRPDDEPADMSLRCPGCGYLAAGHLFYTDCDYLNQSEVVKLLAEIEEGERQGLLDYGIDAVDGGGWREIARAVIEMSDADEDVKAEVRRIKDLT